MRTRVVLDGETLATLRSEAEIGVLERGRRGGVRLSVGLERTLEDGSVARAIVEARLDRTGRLTVDPHSTCADASLDDLAPTRVTRHLLDALGPWSGRDGTVSSDLAETSAPVTLDGEPVRRGETTASLGTIHLGDWSLEPRGTATLRTRRRLDPDDALRGRAELVVTAPVHARSVNGATRDGTLVVETDLRSEASEPGAPPRCGEWEGPLRAAEPTAPEAAAPPAAAFDVQDVIRAINSRRAAITRCY